MIHVSVIKKPKSFMKRIPDPKEDIMPSAIVSADHHDFMDYRIFLAKEYKHTVGWGILFKEKNRKLPKFMIWTCPRSRKRGVGTAIFKEVAKVTNKIAAYVWDDASQHYYNKMTKQFNVKVLNINNFYVPHK